MEHARGRLQVLHNFVTTRAMQHGRLRTRGTLHRVIMSIVSMFMPPNASVSVSPVCACRVIPTVGGSAAQSF